MSEQFGNAEELIFKRISRLTVDDTASFEGKLHRLACAIYCIGFLHFVNF